MPPSSDIAAEWQRAMRAGDIMAAHAISDLVMAGRDPAGADDPSKPYHERWVWDGTPPDGRDILVRCYHGLGDTVQFCRFLPALAARAARVTVEVQAPLRAFLAPQWPSVRFAAFDPARPLPAPPGAIAAEIMELQHLLRAGPDAAPYLDADPLPGMAGATALCGRGGGWDPGRDIPLDLLRGAVPGPLACAQHGHRGPGFASLIGDGDVATMAAMLRGVRRVVTVDTFVAHLAGALGAPLTILLRAHADWRWGRAGRTPWYPSAALLRQTTEGDWSAPLAMLRAG